MKRKYFIELDFADSIERAKKLAKIYNLEIGRVEEGGPAGGWPVIQFIGTKHNLIKYIVKSYDPDGNEDYDDYIANFQRF